MKTISYIEDMRDTRSYRYELGYKVGLDEDFKYPSHLVSERSSEFQMGYWDAKGDKELVDTAQ